ncbi:MAG: serine/threonine-protein kinase [Gemmatimonadales bacterium]|jgi:serine/threonine protein kinase/tetratricopeptide (TPR) repeat protein
MTALLDRLREALAPDYEVERELASGGMGVVFLGRDVALDRRVAIKIIKPELATAAAAERFIREARILASLNHPNVIPVHRAGESGGLFYYVMEYLEAETMADRLARGALPAAEAVAVARDVLSALEAVHGRGVVHRDVKPANIFVLKGRAVLADFGIAKDTAATGPGLTGDGRVVGSPGYMAPEQMAGGDVGAATDLYAVGLVLYEALTGEIWPLLTEPSGADWSRVPPWLVAVLQRALAWRAADRWHSAASFRRALSPARARRWSRTRWVAAALVVAAAALTVDHLMRPPSPGLSTLRIRVRPFAVGRVPSAPADLGDSLATVLVRSLGGSPDFSAGVGRASPAEGGPALTFTGAGEVGRDGTLLLTLESDTAEGIAEPLHAEARGPVAEWRTLAADSLAYQLLVQIWSLRGGKLAASLPIHALPRTSRGLAAWIAADRLFAHAQWNAAEDAYQEAIAVDSTCLLCRVRLTDVGRWIGRDQGRAETARYRAALDSFPPRYRRIIEASFAPHERRVPMLDEAATRFGDFGLAWFLKGDETFHRGPLDGYRRHDALAAMERATELWPDFAPGWEHLAWIAIGEGDSVLASQALDSLKHISGQDPFEAEIRTLLDVCYRWRFAPLSQAVAYTQGVLRDPGILQVPDLGAGARYMMTCDAPRGAVWIGEAFQHVGRPNLEAAGLFAEVYGYLALGRPDSARAVTARLRSRANEPDAEVSLAELPGALLLADSADAATVARAWPEVRRALERFTDPAAGNPALARRSAWLLALVARRAGDTAAARRFARRLDDEPPPRPFATLVDLDADAAAGRLGTALRGSVPLLALDSAGQAGDPFFRAMLHLMRAQWHAALGDTAAAVRDLRWHENNDLRTVTYPAAGAEPAEIDWALGTLARWRRARLLDAPPGDPEGCACYAAVARLWSGGEAAFAARADTARRRFAALGCGRSR